MAVENLQTIKGTLYAKDTNEPDEVWKNVVGYEGLYQVSSHGRVKSFYNNKWGMGAERILKSGLHDRGRTNNYKIVVLAKDGIHKTKTVHRLVATAFIPNAENKPFINHKDGNTLNNFASNIEWCTARENSQDCLKRGTFITGESVYNAKFSNEQIRDIRKNFKGEWGEITKLAIEFNVSPSAMQELITNKTYKHI